MYVVKNNIYCTHTEHQATLPISISCRFWLNHSSQQKKKKRLNSCPPDTRNTPYQNIGLWSLNQKLSLVLLHGPNAHWHFHFQHHPTLKFQLHPAQVCRSHVHAGSHYQSPIGTIFHISSSDPSNHQGIATPSLVIIVPKPRLHSAM